MKIKILLVCLLGMASIPTYAIFLPDMKINRELEDECSRLSKSSQAEKVSVCETYYDGLLKTSAARIDSCEDDPTCLKNEKKTKFSLDQSLQGIKLQSAQFKSEKADANLSCRKQAEQARKNAPHNSGNTSLDGTKGSESMQKCAKLTRGYMRSLYSSKGGRGNMNVSWSTLIESSEECISSAEKSCEEGLDFSAGLKKCAAEDGETKKLAGLCDAAAYLISFEKDWENSEDVSPQSATGGNPQITCRSLGVETLDYNGCAKFVQNGDVMEVAQAAIQTGQNLYYQDKAMTAQMNASASPESATAGLQALKTGVKGQEDIMTQRAVLESGKFTALASYYNEMPSKESLEERCNSYRAPDGLNAAQAKDYCRNTFNQALFAMLYNQPVKEKMKAKLVSVGINVGSNAVMATLMAKRASDIENAIAKVDSFKPLDPLAPSMDNMQTTFCQQNPGSTQCLTGGLEKTFDVMGDNVISFGEGGTGTTYTNTNPNPAGPILANGSSTPLGGDAVTGMGNIAPVASQKGGLADVVAAATVTKGAAPTSQGSGAGGGASAGTGGGSGSGTPPAGSPGGPTAAIPGKAPSYGGGTGTLSMMGGYGINKNKTAVKDDANPFGKLFNKDASKSGAIDFQGRSPASQKVGTRGDNIFEMISKRYTNVSSDKRLIEYEMTK